jgi:hypothetical protein
MVYDQYLLSEMDLRKFFWQSKNSPLWTRGGRSGI